VKVSAFQLLKDVITGALIIFGGIYVLIAIGSMSFRSPAPTPAVESSSVPVGSEGRIVNGRPVIPVAIDEELLPALKRLEANQSLNGIGPVFYVNEDTEVRVSESGPNGLRVRILTGPQKGRTGWVPSDWVKPLK